jgi:RNA recognition motif-containing protein
MPATTKDLQSALVAGTTQPGAPQRKRTRPQHQHKERAMTRKLHVGNLTSNTSEATLRSLFAQSGEVMSVTVIADRAPGTSRAFAFVEMADDEGARQAISQLNGNSLDGRMIIVSEAYPRTPHNSIDDDSSAYRGYRR